MSDSVAAIRWLEWGTAAFERATGEDKPVLLSLVAPWCEQCAAMDRATYARPEVVRLIETAFVPVRVDTDRRPDINERYNLGGWPTTAFLTPDGEILGGGTFVDAVQMPELLARVVDAFVHRRAEITTRETEARTARESRDDAPVEPPDRLGRGGGLATEDPVDWLSARLLERFDAQHGGFGDGPKFPHVPALTLALERYVDTGDPGFARVVTTSLDGLAALHDAVEGGFFRYASRRDWRQPHTEKVLSDNAMLVRFHLDAGATLGCGEYLERAERALRWVHETLADVQQGGFAASQAGDGTYYSIASRAVRGEHAPPRVDSTQYTAANAEMIATYLRAADVLGESAWRDFALRSLDRTMLAAYRPGFGVAHVSTPEPDVWGLLADQMTTADVLLRAHMATGQLPYSMLAAELIHYALRTMWNREGGFRDRVSGNQDIECGLLRRPLIPFAPNCEAARVLSRLSVVTGQSSYQDRAKQTLNALADTYREDPLLGASYGLAVREVRDGVRPPGLSLSYVDWKLSEMDDH